MIGMILYGLMIIGSALSAVVNLETAIKGK
jgi:hypothetical protein